MATQAIGDRQQGSRPAIERDLPPVRCPRLLDCTAVAPNELEKIFTHHELSIPWWNQF